MEKPHSARRMPIIAIVLLAALAVCAVVLYAVRALDRQNRARYDITNEDTDIPILASGDRLQDWAEAARISAASDLQDLDLVRASCVVFDGAFDTIRLEFYRYIDETRDGGNIRSVKVSIDAVRGTIKNIATYEGACGEVNQYEHDAPIPVDVLQRRASTFEAMVVKETGQPLDPTQSVVWAYLQENGEAIEHAFAQTLIDWSNIELPSIDDIPKLHIR